MRCNLIAANREMIIACDNQASRNIWGHVEVLDLQDKIRVLWEDENTLQHVWVTAESITITHFVLKDDALKWEIFESRITEKNRKEVLAIFNALKIDRRVYNFAYSLVLE